MKFSTRLLWMIVLASFLASACQPTLATPSPLPITPPQPLPTSSPASTSQEAVTSTPTLESTPTPLPLVPNFSHIVIIIFENKEFGTVIGNGKMAYFNLLASTYTLLTQHYATTHPSLPNYISLIGGDTFGITSNCEDCFINAPEPA